MASERPNRRLLLVDTTLAVAVFFLGITDRIGVNAAALGYSREPDAINTAIIAIQTLPLALRRRYPRSVLAITIGAWAIDRALDYPGTLASVGVVLAIHALGSELPSKTSLRIGAPLVLAVTLFTILGSLILESVDPAAVVFTFVAMAVPLALGREIHQRRIRVQQLEERAERAEWEREEQARRAVEGERARIARDLHDVVAHQMAVMTLQAEGARRLARDADPRIGEALDVIRASGHEALTEMRRMVELLRTDGADRRTDLAPQPGLNRLEELTQQLGEAGLHVELQVDGARRPLAAGIDVSAYRIIQESLTNALKHAGPDATARVHLTYGPDALHIEVSDDGKGGALGDNGGGHGLAGMRERVAVVDGTFHAGPRPGGGFTVRAEMPVHS